MRRNLLLFLGLSLSLCLSSGAAGPKLEAHLDHLSEPGLLDVDPRGPRAVVGFGLGKPNGSVVLIERQSGKQLWSLAMRNLRECYLCDQGRLLFVATPEGWTMWDTVSYKPRAQVRIANKAAGANFDGSQIIVAQGSTIKIYDARGKLLDTFAGGSDQYEHLAVTGDGNHFALFGRKGFYLYDVPNRNNFSENSGTVAFHPDSRALVRQSPTGWMIDLGLENGVGLTKPVQTHTGGEVAFSPDGSLILSQGLDEGGHYLAQVWSFPKLTLVSSHVLVSPGGQAHSAFSSDGKNVASWEFGGQTEIWNALSGALAVGPLKLPAHLSLVSSGPNWLVGVGGPAGKGFYRSYAW